jgi:hypothetical protein
MIAVVQMLPFITVLLVVLGVIIRYADDLFAEVAALTFVVVGGVTLIVAVVALFINGLGRWREWWN